MSESMPVQAAPAPSANPEKYKVLVVILTVVTTVLTAIIAGLQADANIRASISNRDSQNYAILAEGELHRQGLQSTYDFNIMGAYLRDASIATIMNITALQQDQAGDSQGSQSSQQQALQAQARSDAAKKFSVFFTDARYSSTSADGMPDMQAYLTGLGDQAKALVEKQNAAVDNYNRWNSKGDSYSNVLAILAVAFFLLGLAQALAPRLRLLFAIFGSVAILGSLLWTFIIVVS